MPSSFEHRYAELLGAGGFQRRHCPAGQPVTPDPQSQPLILIEQGRMLATVLDDAGRECLCALRGAESLLGFEALDGQPFPYALWPLSDSKLWMTSRSAVNLVMAEPAVLRTLMMLAARAHRLQLQERLMLGCSATARLARFLALAEQIGEPRSDRVGLPRHVMARVLAMRPETMSRALRRLQLAGAIEVGSDIRIIDRARLTDASE